MGGTQGDIMTTTTIAKPKFFTETTEVQHSVPASTSPQAAVNTVGPAALAVAVSPTTSNKLGMSTVREIVAAAVRTLGMFYDIVCGPPTTDRQRNEAALADLQARGHSYHHDAHGIR